MRIKFPEYSIGESFCLCWRGGIHIVAQVGWESRVGDGKSSCLGLERANHVVEGRGDIWPSGERGGGSPSLAVK